MGGVSGPDVEALQVRLKHTLAQERWSQGAPPQPCFSSREPALPVHPPPSQGPASFLPLHYLPLSVLPAPLVPTLSSFIRASAPGIRVLHLHLHLGSPPPMLHTAKASSHPAFPSAPARQSHLSDREGRPGSRAHPALDGHGGHVLEHHVLHFTAERSSRGTRSLGQGQGRRRGRGREVGPRGGRRGRVSGKVGGGRDWSQCGGAGGLGWRAPHSR